MFKTISVNKAASAPEAIAAVAAIEQFLRDFAPAAVAEETSRWAEVAILEGVEREPAFGDRW